MLRNAQESGIALPDAEKTDLSVLSGADERQLIKQIALLPEEIVQSAVSRDPSRLNKYAVALAQQFHHFYNACRIKDAEPGGARRASDPVPGGKADHRERAEAHRR